MSVSKHTPSGKLHKHLLTLMDPLAKPGLTAIYSCTSCDSPLFEATKKFDAGCGFPSFWMHYGDHVTLNPLNTYGRSRIQLLCTHCGAHLGHLFPNKSTPTQVRYCINEKAIR